MKEFIEDLKKLENLNRELETKLKAYAIRFNWVSEKTAIHLPEKVFLDKFPKYKVNHWKDIFEYELFSEIDNFYFFALTNKLPKEKPLLVGAEEN